MYIGSRGRGGEGQLGLCNFWITPLTPKSDLNVISPNNITCESNIKGMRIKEIFTN